MRICKVDGNEVATFAVVAVAGLIVVYLTMSLFQADPVGETGNDVDRGAGSSSDATSTSDEVAEREPPAGAVDKSTADKEDGDDAPAAKPAAKEAQESSGAVKPGAATETMTGESSGDGEASSAGAGSAGS